MILIDTLLSGIETPAPSPVQDSFVLVTPEGKELGQGSQHALRLVLTPSTIYEHQPDQRLGINSLGLRGPEIDLVPTRPRVIVVGGSAVFGPNQFSFVADLQNARTDYEFLNGGVIGYLSRQELALVVFKLLDLQPTVIIAFNGWNDLYDRYWWRRYGHSDVPHRGVNVNFNFIENRLVNYRRIEWEPSYALVEAARSIVRGSTLLSSLARALGPGYPPAASPEIDTAMIDEAVSDYVTNMKTLRDVANSRGSRLLVVIQPELGQFLNRDEIEEGKAWIKRRRLNHEEWEGYFDVFPDAYLEFRVRVVVALAEAGIDVIDITNRLKRDGVGFRQFIDPVHLSRNGHAHIARLLSSELPPADSLADLE